LIDQASPAAENVMPTPLAGGLQPASYQSNYLMDDDPRTLHGGGGSSVTDFTKPESEMRETLFRAKCGKYQRKIEDMKLCKLHV
jgi:hypothetical protein